MTDKPNLGGEMIGGRPVRNWVALIRGGSTNTPQERIACAEMLIQAARDGLRKERDEARAELLVVKSERDQLAGFKRGALEQAERNRRELAQVTKERDEARAELALIESRLSELEHSHEASCVDCKGAMNHLDDRLTEHERQMSEHRKNWRRQGSRELK